MPFELTYESVCGIECEVKSNVNPSTLPFGRPWNRRSGLGQLFNHSDSRSIFLLASLSRSLSTRRTGPEEVWALRNDEMPSDYLSARGAEQPYTFASRLPWRRTVGEEAEGIVAMIEEIGAEQVQRGKTRP